MREAAGAPVPLEPLLVDIVKGLVLRLDLGLGRKVIEEYKARCATLGAGVTFTEGAAIVSGRAIDVDADGALVVELADGSKRRVSSGEVRHLRESG
jgi:biotin-(acetyl-CoA carboxylase) ligase